MVWNICKTIFLSLILWSCLAYSMHRDRSRYRNTFLLSLALLGTVPVIMLPIRSSRFSVVLYVLMIWLLALLPFSLIVNGIQMLRKEGRSLANLLSLFSGIFLLAGEISIYVLTSSPIASPSLFLSPFWSHIPFLMILISVIVLYTSLIFVSFLFYTLLLQILPFKRNFDVIIILGAGLIHGNQVSKLLADRLDKAIQIYHRGGSQAILMPSGGKGKDETVAEADAMAAYLKDHGIPENQILPETQSMNTLQNLTNCQKILTSSEKFSGNFSGSQSTILVTSNYHVYRALRYARKIGLSCTGAGSHVAFYYWPSALIREFIAIHHEKKHLILFLLGLAISLTAVLLAFST